MTVFILIEYDCIGYNIVKVYSNYIKALGEINKIPKVRRKMYEIKEYEVE